ARSSLAQAEQSSRLKPLARRAVPILDLKIARMQHRFGRLREVRETMRRIEAEVGFLELPQNDPSFFPYDEACVYALLSALVGRPGVAPSPPERAEIGNYQERAMTALRRAIALGFRDADLMRSDRDLDALRSRPDFQKMLMDLAFPADPFA